MLPPYLLICFHTRVREIASRRGASDRFSSEQVNVSGIGVPQSWIDEIGGVEKEDRKMKAADMMGRFLAEVKDLGQGVHRMSLGRADRVPKILQIAPIAV